MSSRNLQLSNNCQWTSVRRIFSKAIKINKILTKIKTARQFPHDIEHSEAGLSGTLLETFLEDLNEAGITRLDQLILTYENSNQWPHFPSLRHFSDFNFEQTKKLVKLLPTLLRGFLCEGDNSFPGLPKNFQRKNKNFFYFTSILQMFSRGTT